MRPDVILAVQKSMIATLRAAAPAPMKVWAHPPAEAAMPLTVLGRIVAEGGDTFGDGIIRMLVTVQVFTQNRGEKETLTAMQPMFVALHEPASPPALTVGRIVRIRVLRTEVTVDGDSATYIGALNLELIVSIPEA